MKQLILSDYEFEVLFELCIHSRQSCFPQKDVTDVVNKVYDLYKEVPNDRKVAINKFLEKEFNIIPGCCSSQKSFEYDIAYLVADKLWK